MVTEYLTEHSGQFNCHRFTFRSNNEVVLSEDDIKELEQHIFETKYQHEIIYKDNKIMNLENSIEEYENLAMGLSELVQIGNLLRDKG